MERSNKSRSALRVLLSFTLLCAAVGAVIGAAPESATASDRPVLYLTFDDGPARDGATRRLLDVLERHGAQATFFLVGINVELDPDAVRSIVSRGHALGNHTWSHERLTDLDDAGVRNQFAEAQRVIGALGGAPSCYRPPYGATDDRVRSIAAEFGMVEELWDAALIDWDRSRTVDDFAAVLNRASDGDVILLHDGWIGQQDTIDAVERFLSANQEKFEFRALPSCESGASNPPAPDRGPVPPSGPTVDGAPNDRADSPAPSRAWLQPVAPIDVNADSMQIERLFQGILGRGSDPVGLEFWEEFVSSASMDEAAQWFLSSPEFRAMSDTDIDEVFLSRLYRNALGRQADEGGVQYWASRLDADLTRTEVAQYFVDSVELRNRLPFLRMSPALLSGVEAMTSQRMPVAVAYELWLVERANGLGAALAAAEALLLPPS